MTVPSERPQSAAGASANRLTAAFGINLGLFECIDHSTREFERLLFHSGVDH